MPVRESPLAQFDLDLLSTGIRGIRTLAPPPAGFDPLTATPEELQRHLLQHRPDPRMSARAVKFWRKAVSRARSFVTPELKLRPAGRPSRLARPQAEAGHVTNSAWAGVIASEGSFTQVWGIMVMPNVVAPSGPAAAPIGQGDPNYCFSAWVGMDGTDGSGDVCQAGFETDLYVDGDGQVSPSTYCWAEWFPLGTLTESLSFSAGDTVAMMIQYYGFNSSTSSYEASVHLSDLTTGVALTPIILSIEQSQIGSAFQGNTAEWIVEPTAFLNSQNQWTAAALPDFGDLIFVDAGALSQPGGSKGTVVNGSLESQTTSVIVNNDVLASEFSTGALQISYLPTAGSSDDPGYEYPI
jgi:hypothetical protein